jgi:hypothetical protein
VESLVAARALGKRRSNVFINMPFDSEGRYRHLLVAYVAGLAGLGFTPRCVLEIPPYPNRLERLRKIIAECASSVHELSCVKTESGFPRFNMPFELGMVVGMNTHRWFVFESERFRLDRTLSDVKGHDVPIHNGDPEDLIVKLRDVFQTRRSALTLRRLRHVHDGVKKLAEKIEGDHGSLLSRAAFSELVLGAQEIAERERHVKRRRPH